MKKKKIDDLNSYTTKSYMRYFYNVTLFKKFIPIFDTLFIVQYFSAVSRYLYIMYK